MAQQQQSEQPHRYNKCDNKKCVITLVNYFHRADIGNSLLQLFYAAASALFIGVDFASGTSVAKSQYCWDYVVRASFLLFSH